MKLFIAASFCLISASPSLAENASDTSSSDRFTQLEKQHEDEMIGKMEERHMVWRDLKKDTTPECRFWRLQYQTKPSAKATQKVREHCSSKTQSSLVQTKK